MYLIRFTDGTYNEGQGNPVSKAEATRYETRQEAERMAVDLYDVTCIHDEDDPYDTVQSVFDALAEDKTSPLQALAKIKELCRCT